jgi:hypothetical protein
VRANFLAVMIMICGCSRAPREAPLAQAWAQPTILDRVLAKADYSNALVQAECDLPSDKWRTNFFGPRNVSRDDRESAVGEAMIATIKPCLKDMSVTELIKSLKAMPYPDCVIIWCLSGDKLR